MICVKDLSIAVPGFSLQGVSFEVPDGAYGILMGPTGCGKTTLIEAICGLRPVSAGRIVLHGRDITRAKPGERGIGYVPQDDALFPTMTVHDHLAFALRLRRWPKDQQRRRIDELADLLGLTHLLNRKPGGRAGSGGGGGLSGGERQRVALGRALSFKPEVLCLDEPLSALDEETRARMIDLLARVQQHEHVTALHITHNSSEARTLGTQVLRLIDGRVVHEQNPHQPTTPAL